MATKTKYVLPNTSDYLTPTSASAYRSLIDYSAPNSKYSAPKSEFSAPNSQYSAPSSDYSTPNSKYSAPNSQYSDQNSYSSASSSQYSAPKSDYSAPNSQYSAPNSDYSAGSSGRRIRPLNRGYLAPEDNLEEYNAVESVNTERRIPPPKKAKSTFYAVPETKVVSYFDEGEQHQPSYGRGGGGHSGSGAGGGGGRDYLKMLMNVFPGIPGQDYPLYGEIPQTSFSCQGRVFGGFYADPATQCQVNFRSNDFSSWTDSPTS